MSSLHDAIINNDHKTFVEVMSQKRVPINQVWKDRTPLAWACRHGHVRMASCLLRCPSIIVNKGDLHHNPSMLASEHNQVECLRLLLNDKFFVAPDVAFFYVTCYRHLEVLKEWIVSGVEFRATAEVLESGHIQRFQYESERFPTDFSRLWEQYIAEPEETRERLRIETKWYDHRAADYFMLCVFVCDGYLDMKGADPHQQRFVSIANKLPMELQMIFCHRAAQSAGSAINSHFFEEACRRFCKTLLV